jgi:hypothetical protein
VIPNPFKYETTYKDWYWLRFWNPTESLEEEPDGSVRDATIIISRSPGEESRTGSWELRQQTVDSQNRRELAMYRAKIPSH